MRKLIVSGLILMVFQQSGAQANKLEMAWHNTFSGRFLNNWTLINEAENTDSITLIESKMGDTSFFYIENQVKTFILPKYTMIIDDVEKFIYLAPNKKRSKKRMVELPDTIFSTAQLVENIDSSTYKLRWEDNEYTIGIDPNGLLIRYIETSMLNDANEDHEMQRGDLDQVKIRYILENHYSRTHDILKFANPGNYIHFKNKTYTAVGKYNSYELINLIEQ